MPTGYTADIAKDITFNEFALTCARNFGALIMMRDEPLDAQIPDEFPPSDYHLKAAQEEKDKLCLLDAFTLEDATRQLRLEHEKSVQSNKKYNDDKIKLKAKYVAMLLKAKAWQPPTADHQGLKEFMIKQIEESIKWDCEPYNHTKPLKDPQTWLNEEKAYCIEQIAYHEQKYAEEVERSKGRSEWVKQLKKSLAQ